MKRHIFSMAAFTVLAGMLVGCKPAANGPVGEETVEIGPKYSAKNGLLVPDDTRQSLGLKIIEVTEQKVTATLEVQLRVYHEGGESILASATVTPEEEKRLKRGQAVRTRSNGTSFTGSVIGVNDQLQKATGMAEMLVELARTNGAPGVGAFLPASVALESEASVVSIPRAALLESSDGPSVYTVSGEHLVRTPVKVGAVSEDLVEIKDGLYAGDQVVLQPVMSLWMTELAAVKGGQACCAVPAKGK